ncbi:hypothetical protein CRG98_019593 [Punica granatum]|uniref:Uncharacterized protein n=1 Tax=Punica granatum TaxID=22663 RepID=A0A2I0JUP0_PUNGR|nr:hypothetical protein CRG98_019593 [Punica granatum]
MSPSPWHNGYVPNHFLRPDSSPILGPFSVAGEPHRHRPEFQLTLSKRPSPFVSSSELSPSPAMDYRFRSQRRVQIDEPPEEEEHGMRLWPCNINVRDDQEPFMGFQGPQEGVQDYKGDYLDLLGAPSRPPPPRARSPVSVSSDDAVWIPFSFMNCLTSSHLVRVAGRRVHVQQQNTVPCFLSFQLYQVLDHSFPKGRHDRGSCEHWARSSM